jgi:hypothetical protein
MEVALVKEILATKLLRVKKRTLELLLGGVYWTTCRSCAMSSDS